MSQTQYQTTFVRFFEDAIGGGALDILDEVLDRNVVHHSQPTTGVSPAEAIRKHIADIRKAFLDYRTKVHDMLVDGDRLAARCTVYGTKPGDGSPGSAKPFAMDEILIVKFKEGRICDIWNVADRLSLMQQIGALPR